MCCTLSLWLSFTCLHQRFAALILSNPSQQRRSDSPVCVSQFSPPAAAAAAARSCIQLRGVLGAGLRGTTGTSPRCVILGFLFYEKGKKKKKKKKVTGGHGADAAQAMTGPGRQSFQAALILLSVAQLTAGTVTGCTPQAAPRPSSALIK